MLQQRIEQARAAVAAKLGYQFSNGALFAQAMTHRSAQAHNNERLEFLGDAILGFVVARALFDHQPELPEGDLTRRRASVVRKETLAEIAREFDLGAALEVGTGELKSGGRDRDSILADAVEALIGAIYLDAGFDVCRERVLAMFADRIRLALSKPTLKDPKTRLQELLQAQGIPLPLYTVMNVVGEAHRQYFTVQCGIESAALAVVGEGGSRRKAEQAAAKEMLNKLEHDGMGSTT